MDEDELALLGTGGGGPSPPSSAPAAAQAPASQQQPASGGPGPGGAPQHPGAMRPAGNPYIHPGQLDHAQLQRPALAAANPGAPTLQRPPPQQPPGAAARPPQAQQQQAQGFAEAEQKPVNRQQGGGDRERSAADTLAKMVTFWVSLAQKRPALKELEPLIPGVKAGRVTKADLAVKLRELCPDLGDQAYPVLEKYCKDWAQRRKAQMAQAAPAMTDDMKAQLVAGDGRRFAASGYRPPKVSVLGEGARSAVVAQMRDRGMAGDPAVSARTFLDSAVGQHVGGVLQRLVDMSRVRLDLDKWGWEVEVRSEARRYVVKVVKDEREAASKRKERKAEMELLLKTRKRRQADTADAGPADKKAKLSRPAGPAGVWFSGPSLSLKNTGAKPKTFAGAPKLSRSTPGAGPSSGAQPAAGAAAEAEEAKAKEDAAIMATIEDTYAAEAERKRRIVLEDLAAVLQSDPRYRRSQVLYKLYEKMAKEEREAYAEAD
ncbi:unnamed protein product [Pedinophyceae sp. YPF-701]|nr:unnamed protein product [Pedinophyceae sp. YPF-701]